MAAIAAKICGYLLFLVELHCNSLFLFGNFSHFFCDVVECSQLARKAFPVEEVKM